MTHYMISSGFLILAVTMLCQLTWIMFRSFEKGPPPDWSMYPVIPGCALLIVGFTLEAVR